MKRLKTEMSADITKLIEVMARLRDENTGCSWDLSQSHKTLMPQTTEEMNEMFYAITTNDSENLKEEIGDVLFHLVFYTRISEEKGDFDFSDVIDAVCEKMIRRHPHIFAGKKYKNKKEQSDDWQRIKLEEKQSKGKVNDNNLFPVEIKSLAAIEQGVMIQNSMAKLGFDWNNTNQIIAKISEESAEVVEAIESGNKEHIFEEYGDLLFAVLNLGRKLDIDSDLALREANLKFIQRSENMIKEAGSIESFAKLSILEQESIWAKVKELEGAN